MSERHNLPNTPFRRPGFTSTGANRGVTASQNMSYLTAISDTTFGGLADQNLGVAPSLRLQKAHDRLIARLGAPSPSLFDQVTVDTDSKPSNLNADPPALTGALRSPFHVDEKILYDGPSPLLGPGGEVPWYSAFKSGATNADPEYQRTQASVLVDEHSWNSKSILQLAREFCVVGYDESIEHSNSVGTPQFAKCVYDRFLHTRGQQMARIFLQHLRDSVMESFQNFWGSGLRIVQQHDNLNAHLRLAFIGDLHTQGLLMSGTVYQCIEILLLELRLPDHLRALHMLLSHCLPSLWQNAAGQQSKNVFLNALHMKLMQMQHVRELQWEKQEIRRLIEVIREDTERNAA